MSFLARSGVMPVTVRAESESCMHGVHGS
jgi:hypothetical protein